MPGERAACWFDSPYYYALYEHRDDAEARLFVAHLARFLSLGPGSRVLDLGCGRGRHALYLGATGADVTGIDIAPEAIAYARRYEHDRLHFGVGDMREPYGVGRFSEILSLFTSFGYFDGDDDNVDVLRLAAHALRPGGRFVLDYLNADKALRTLVPYEVKRVRTVRFEIARRFEGGFFVKDIAASEGGVTQRFQERVQALALTDLLALLLRVGLHVSHVFGDYALSPFDAPTSDRLILVAKKPAGGATLSSGPAS